MRTIGVEEELLLVERGSGQPLAVSGQALHQWVEEHPEGEDDEPGGNLVHELQRQQLETDTHPRERLADLEQELREWRARAIEVARGAGAAVAAVGTSPLPVEPKVAADPRFQRMQEKFGMTTAESLTCGCHVHVAIDSAEEGVGVLDRIRVWLPSLLALSANSPFWQGKDTSYASFRSQASIRWPSAGPNDIYGSAASYRSLVDRMVSSGVLLDEGMIYFDARLAKDYPTVEIRIADVCLDVRDAVLVAGLCRALVDTTAQEWRRGQPPPPVATPMLRLAVWQAGRFSIHEDLLDPVTCDPRPAGDVLADLVDYVRPALRETGDEELVEAGVARVLAEGNGADRQRRVQQRTGDLRDVIAEVLSVTAS
jgi:carboxylate-amine ligase